MPDGNPLAQRDGVTPVAVQGGVILHVAVFPDCNGIQVTAQDSPVPYAAALHQRHIPRKGGVWRNKRRAAGLGGLVLQLFDHKKPPPVVLLPHIVAFCAAVVKHLQNCPFYRFAR